MKPDAPDFRRDAPTRADALTEPDREIVHLARRGVARRVPAQGGRRHGVHAVLGVVAAATVYTPRTYRSQTKLFLRLGRENATLDATATLGQNPVVALPPTRDNEINSVLEILKSRVLLEKVADRVGPAVILGKFAL